MAQSKLQDDGFLNLLLRTLLAIGFSLSKVDYSIFIKITKASSTYVLVYVDDIIVARDDLQSITSLKAFLNKHCHLKGLSPLKCFIGIEVARSHKGLFLCQQKYTLDILHDMGMLGARISPFPVVQHLKLSSTYGDLLEDPSQYRWLMGQLIYVTIISRIFFIQFAF